MKMATTLRHVILLGLLLLLPLQAWAKREFYHLYVGEVRVLNVTDIERVAVGNGKLLSTQILKNGQLVILPEKPGMTQVYIWDSKGRQRRLTVQISKDDAGTLSREIRTLLSQVPGVSVTTVGGKVVLSGQVDKKYKPVLGAIAQQYPGVVNLTTDGGVGDQKMIYMRVKITEFNTNRLEELGINWTNKINGPALGLANEFATQNARANGVTVLNAPEQAAFNGGNSSATTAAGGPLGYFGIASEISSRINLAVNNGDALILASPVLSTRSGGEAEFLSGGEVPLPSTNTTGQSNVEFKEFGIKLKIKPVANDSGVIQANVETSISTVDQSLAVNNIPGFRTRKTQADISIHDGETLVISGLVNSQTAKDASGIAWLRDLPVLGPLFRSTTFRNEKSELVIFVTPRVIDPDSEVNRLAIKRAEQLKDRFFRAIEESAEILD